MANQSELEKEIRGKLKVNRRELSIVYSNILSQEGTLKDLACKIQDLTKALQDLNEKKEFESNHLGTLKSDYNRMLEEQRGLRAELKRVDEDKSEIEHELRVQAKRIIDSVSCSNVDEVLSKDEKGYFTKFKDIIRFKTGKEIKVNDEIVSTVKTFNAECFRDYNLDITKRNLGIKFIFKDKELGAKFESGLETTIANGYSDCVSARLFTALREFKDTIDLNRYYRESVIVPAENFDLDEHVGYLRSRVGSPSAKAYYFNIDEDSIFVFMPPSAISCSLEYLYELTSYGLFDLAIYDNCK